MSASIQSSIQRIELVTEYMLDGEPERTVQDLAVQFLSDDMAVVMASSGILEDFRLLFGDAIVVSPRSDGSYDLVGVQHPSPMRHFESDGHPADLFPEASLHRIGGTWESELTTWITHVPAKDYSAFCVQTGLIFHPATEIFSGLSSLLLD
jgi:hypothetical protein